MKTKRKAVPQLETDRLILREMTHDDKDALFLSFSDKDVTKYFSMNPFTSVEEAGKIVERAQTLFEQEKGIQWGIVMKGDTTLVGTCGYESWIKQSFRGELGYDLRQSHWGKGIMSEALQAVIAYGFKPMGLNRIEVTTRSDNMRSIKMLCRLGFCKEGRFREYTYWDGEFHDELFFSLLKKEWITQVR
jgi:ribosomal-protein-alanine N-acetyltransferase